MATNSSALLDKLKAAGSIKISEVLSKSTFFNEKDVIPTEIPILNVALSGKLDGGLLSGLTFLAGPSKHFKSLLGLMLVKAYMNKYPESICLFYDSEFGITPDYLVANGIDTNRVLHIPIEHLEQLKFDISKRLDEIKRGDKVIIFMDSVGNLASVKEVEDALEEKSVADMSRARVLKSLFRIITPHFATKDIPCIAVNHTYQEMALFPKTIMSGGSGPMYASNAVFIIGKSQEKEGSELVGWNFTINIEKSRFVKEKSKLPITVTYKGGVDKYSGMLDLALEAGLIKQSGAWYQVVNPETGEIAEKKIQKSKIDDQFYKDLLGSDQFKEFIKSKFLLAHKVTMMQDEEEENA